MNVIGPVVMKPAEEKEFNRNRPIQTARKKEPMKQNSEPMKLRLSLMKP